MKDLRFQLTVKTISNTHIINAPEVGHLHDGDVHTHEGAGKEDNLLDLYMSQFASAPKKDKKSLAKSSIQGGRKRRTPRTGGSRKRKSMLRRTLHVHKPKNETKLMPTPIKEELRKTEKPST